jgi:hypothetical protein
MSTSPVTPAGSLSALAVVQLLTARALNAMGGEQVAAQSQTEPAPQALPQPPAAIAAATLDAASHQGGAAPLFADLAAVVQSPGLPQPVVAAAQQVLALATPLDPPPSGADLKTALGQSGLLLEAHFAAGEGPPADLKAALLNLQQTLQTAVEAEPSEPPAALAAQAPALPTPQTPLAAPQQAVAPPEAQPEPTTPPATQVPPVAMTSAEPVPPEEPETSPPATLIAAQAEAQLPLDAAMQPQIQQAAYPQAMPQALTPQQAAAQPAGPAPPYPDGPVRAQPPVDPAAALAAGASQVATTHRLLEDTTAALARQVLFQLASAPAAQHADDPNNVRWMFELPLATPQGTAVAQFEIDRDGGEGGGAAQGQGDDGQPAWRARFSLDLGDMGPVHAQVSLGGGHAGVSLWAERPETAQALRAGRTQLADEFKADAVDADVAVFFGQPPTPAPRAGRLLDQAL